MPNPISFLPLLFGYIRTHAEGGGKGGRGELLHIQVVRKKSRRLFSWLVFCCSILSLSLSYLTYLCPLPFFLCLSRGKREERKRTNDVTTERRARHTAPASRSITERVWLIRFFGGEYIRSVSLSLPSATITPVQHRPLSGTAAAAAPTEKFKIFRFNIFFFFMLGQLIFD